MTGLPKALGQHSVIRPTDQSTGIGGKPGRGTDWDRQPGRLCVKQAAEADRAG